MPSITPRLVSFVFVLCVSTWCGSSRADSEKSVHLLRAPEMDWPEGQRGVEAELVASGYAVAHRSSSALEVGVLLDELQVESTEAPLARVAILRIGRSGIAYVWLRSSGSTYRVTSGDPDPARAANILSLRVVELINLRGEGLAAEPIASEVNPDKTPAAPEPVVVEPEVSSPETEPRWTLFLGAGITGGSGFDSALPSFEVSLGREVAGPFGVQAAFSVDIHPSSQRFESGTVDVGRTGGALGAFVGFGRSLWWQLGVAAGVECYSFSWAQTSDVGNRSRSACTANGSAFVRSGLRFQDATLWLSGSMSLGQRAIRLLDADVVIASYGRPAATLSGGVGWLF